MKTLLGPKHMLILLFALRDAVENLLRKCQLERLVNLLQMCSSHMNYKISSQLRNAHA